MLKCLGPNSRKQYNVLDNLIYNTAIWSEDFTMSKMITIPKKTNAKKCEDYRTISLIPHSSKIILKTIYDRIYKKKIDACLGWDQFGFRSGMGTRDAIGTLRVIIEKSIEFGKSLYISFVDYEKAFDRVNWMKLMEVLEIIGLDFSERKLIWELYVNQKALIQVGEEMTEPAEIGQGARQGGTLSSILFNVYVQFLINEAMEENNDGVNINGNLINSIRFADDQAMISHTNVGLQRIMNDLASVGKKYGMRINVTKTKGMRINHQGKTQMKLIVDDAKLEIVEKFTYLGSMITNDGRCEHEIKVRIAKGKASFF